MKKRIIVYIVVSLALTALIILVENIGGMAVGLIPLGWGGDCREYLSPGGNIVIRLFPEYNFSDPNPPTGGTVVQFNLFAFVIMYLARFIVCIPISELILLFRNDK